MPLIGSATDERSSPPVLGAEAVENLERSSPQVAERSLHNPHALSADLSSFVKGDFLRRGL